MVFWYLLRSPLSLRIAGLIVTVIRGLCILADVRSARYFEKPQRQFPDTVYTATQVAIYVTLTTAAIRHLVTSTIGERRNRNYKLIANRLFFAPVALVHSRLSRLTSAHPFFIRSSSRNTSEYWTCRNPSAGVEQVQDGPMGHLSVRVCSTVFRWLEKRQGGR
jgi:hypothetical protein